MKSEIIAELKKEGLNILEDDVAKIVKVAFKLGSARLLASSNQMAVAMGGVLPMFLPAALSFVDKIDGEDDPGR